MISNSIHEYLSEVQVKENPRYNSSAFVEKVIAEGEHTYHLEKFFNAYENKCIRILNPKKQEKFKQIKALLEQSFVMLYENEPLETYELRYLKNDTQVILTIRCEMIVNHEGDTVTNKSRLLSELFAIAPDNFMEVVEGKYIKMIFTINLYDEIFLEDGDKELEELAVKYKVRTSYDLNKYRREESI